MVKTKQIVYTALLAALTCALTMFPSIPVPVIAGAYIHLGDAVIIISVIFIGKNAIVSAATGSFLADIMVGSAIYSPATFIIKGLMALVVYLIMRPKKSVATIFIGAVLAEAIMIAGYFLYEAVLFGIAAAAASMVFGAIQAGAAIIVSTVFFFIIRKTAMYESFK